MEKFVHSANPRFMALCVWPTISWCSTCYFIWPASAPRIGGQLSFPPLLSLENFLAYFSSALWEEREKFFFFFSKKGRKLDGGPVFELLVKSGRHGGMRRGARKR